MIRWPLDVGGYSRDEVDTYCTNDPDWQTFRATMQGQTTEVKLDMLHSWHQERIDKAPRRTKVQVDNYINALKRAGLVSMTLEVTG